MTVLDTRPRLRRTAWLQLATAGLLALLLLLLAPLLPGQIDLTADRLYTLSDASRATLKQLDEPLQVYTIFSPDLPPPYSRIPPMVDRLLRSYRDAGGGYLRVHQLSPDSPQARALIGEHRLPKLELQAVADDRASVQQGYLALVLEYRQRQLAIGAIEAEEGIEYRLTGKIRTLLGEQRGRIGLLTLPGTRTLADLSLLARAIDEEYAWVEVDGDALAAGAPLPPDLSLLLLPGLAAAPPAHLPERLNQLRRDGLGLLLLAGNVELAAGPGLTAQPVTAAANDWLPALGVALEPGLVADPHCSRIGVRRMQDGLLFANQVDYPFIVQVEQPEQIDRHHSLGRYLRAAQIPFAAPLLAAGGGRAAVLLQSSPQAMVQGGPPFEVDPLRSLEARFDGMQRRPSTLALAFDGAAKGGGRMVAVGSRLLLDEQFLTGTNVVLLLDLFDWLAGNDATIELRSRNITVRPLADPGAAGRAFFKGQWLIGLPLLIALLGLWRWRRLRRRWAE